MILSLVEPYSSLHLRFHPAVVGNSLKLAVLAVVGQHSRVTVHCYSSNVIDFAMLPAQRFWLETVSLLVVK